MILAHIRQGGGFATGPDMDPGRCTVRCGSTAEGLPDRAVDAKPCAEAGQIVEDCPTGFCGGMAVATESLRHGHKAFVFAFRKHQSRLFSGMYREFIGKLAKISLQLQRKAVSAPGEEIGFA